MLSPADILRQSIGALRSHKLRAALTTIGLAMGVSTLITVITLIQGANRYVEQKIANLGTDVFKVARLPFILMDFHAYFKALRYKRIEIEDWKAVTEGCRWCLRVGSSVDASVRVRYQDRELADVSLTGHTPNMTEIDKRTIKEGRYFTDAEDRHAARVCLVGDDIVAQLLDRTTALGRVVRAASEECTVVGVFERVGSVLGQEQDNFVILPMTTFLRMRGARSSMTLHVKAPGAAFDQAQDEVRQILRARRRVPSGRPDDFFIGTSATYIEMWKTISEAFFAVFLMVGSISALIGGIVIMNVMLVSVTERTKEIGVRRAVGATAADIRRQFLVESLLQCLAGGAIGIGAGFLCALALRALTDFPADVETWVAILGVALSWAIGLFFGIYPAVRASRLDPVAALRAE